MPSYPTCPTHSVLKPCPHCTTPKHVVTGSVGHTGLKACSDVAKGDRLVTCEVCGELRSTDRSHGEKNRPTWSYP